MKTHIKLPFSILSIVLLCMLTSSFSQKKVDQTEPGLPIYDKLEQLRWLIGTWKTPGADGILYESWTVVNDSTFEGKAYEVKNSGDTVLSESVKIEYKNKSCYFTPIVSDQNNQQPVPFKMVSISNQGFIAENPEHDFPQRITYMLVSGNHIYAFVDGKVEDKYIKNEYFFQKAD